MWGRLTVTDQKGLGGRDVKDRCIGFDGRDVTDDRCTGFDGPM